MSSAAPRLSALQRDHATLMRVLLHRVGETRALATAWRRGEASVVLRSLADRATVAVAADVLGALAGGGLAAAGSGGDVLPTVAPVISELLASDYEDTVSAGVRSLAAALALTREGSSSGGDALLLLAQPLRYAIARLPASSALAAPAATCLAQLAALAAAAPP